MVEDILDEHEIASDSAPENRIATVMNRIGRGTAYVSFGIGTLLLVLYKLGFGRQGEGLLVVGWGYVMVALAVNSLVFLVVCISLFQANDRRKIFATLGIMLLNLPISFGYFLLVVNGH